MAKKVHATVIGVSDSGTELQLDHSVPQHLPLTVECEGMSTTAQTSAEDIITLDGEWLVQQGASLDVIAHCTTPEHIQEELSEFWKQRWWKDNPPNEAEWTRILEFAMAYLPKGQCQDVPITVEQWTATNQRYGPRAARGPDGLDRLDMKLMPHIFQEELVDILNQCEENCAWPQIWRKGFVHSLAKKDGAVIANEFRPIIIYSMVYRTWSSLRAKTFLAHLKTLAGAHQFGFLPHCEAAELWLMTQAVLEAGMQQKEVYTGFITDLKKAFECLPREPIKWLAFHFGLPRKAVSLWFKFLECTERFFVVQGEISNPMSSNSGYPEGCALSCAGMVIAGIALHQYMRIFAGTTLTLSYVDNIEILAQDLGHLQTAIICLQTWTSMWHLELDQDKSFTWATDAKTRTAATQLGWKTETSAKDLGAQMTYGAKKTISVQKGRIDSLAPLWGRLKRCLAPVWQKIQLVYVAF